MLILNKKEPEINARNNFSVFFVAFPLSDTEQIDRLRDKMIKENTLEIKEDDFTDPKEINVLVNSKTKGTIDRYIYAAAYCYGKDVIDLGMGAGVGTKLLKILGAKSVIGIDKNINGIDLARKDTINYIDYIYDDLFNINSINHPNLKERFDVVVSIETMEHLPRERVEDYLNVLKYLCKKGGKILITTPRRQTSEYKYPGGTHLYEYSYEELEFLLATNFTEYSISGFCEFGVSFSNELLMTLLPKLDLDKTKVFFVEITNV